MTTTKEPTKATQLQAKQGKDTNTFAIVMNPETRAVLNNLKDFNSKVLNIKPSVSVLTRRAYIVYAQYLEEQLKDNVTSLPDFIESERLAVFKAAGKPEKAKDRQYIRKERTKGGN